MVPIPSEHPFQTEDDKDDMDKSKLNQSPPMMVHVIAPATLPEGYTFEAQIGAPAPENDPILDTESKKAAGGSTVGGRTFKVTVPEGGVKEGQTFLAPLPRFGGLSKMDGAQGGGGPMIVNAPTGRWKDGLCDWLKYGPCHPAFCCSLWCTQIAMGQVMQRLHLTFLGRPGPYAATRNTYKVVFTLVVCYTIYSLALDLATPAKGKVPPLIVWLKFAGALIFSLWAIYSLCKTRESVREIYSIPEDPRYKCRGCEDLCCSIWCSCCVTAQMLRHTGEYEAYRGDCLDSRGLSKDAPPVV